MRFRIVFNINKEACLEILKTKGFNTYEAIIKELDDDGNEIESESTRILNFIDIPELKDIERLQKVLIDNGVVCYLALDFFDENGEENRYPILFVEDNL